MNNFLNKTIFLLLLLSVTITAYADTAKQVDFLLSGYSHPTSDKPLSGGKVWTFLDNTSTMSALYTDKDQGGTATNPIILDDAGRAEVYGDKIYKFVIYDSANNIIETINGLEYVTILDGVADGIAQTAPVDNIAALRAITYTPVDGDIITVLDYATSGDLGGGDFRWDAASTGTDNDGLIVKVTAITTGRWLRLYKDTLFIEWFGGFGDGVTDCTTAFENAVASSTNPIIQLLKGTYNIGKNDAVFGAIYSSTRTVIIRGAGSTSTTIENTHATGGGIRFSGDSCELTDLTYSNGTSTGFGIYGVASNCIYRNLQIQNQVGASTWAFNIDGGTLSKVNNVKINLNIYNAFKLGGVLPTSHVQVDNLQIDKCTGYQVYLDRVAGTTISRLLLDEGGVEGAVYIESCSQTAFLGMTTEFTSEITLAADSYIAIDNSDSIFFQNWRINHLGGTANKQIFRTQSVVGANNNIVIENGDFTTDQAGMVFLYTNSNDYGISVRNIENLSSIALVGVYNAGAINYETITNFIDRNTISSHTLDALNLVVTNTRGPMAITKRDSQIALNCDGVITGTAARTITRIPLFEETLTETGTSQANGITNLDSTAGIMTITQVDGEGVGLIKVVRMTVNGGNVTYNIASHATTSSFTFNSTTDSLTIRWTGSKWVTIDSFGV